MFTLTSDNHTLDSDNHILNKKLEVNMKNYFFTISLLLLLIIQLKYAEAGNTSGVHGPVVNINDSSAMYRMSFVPGEDGAEDAFTHRLHYQKAINESFRWRVIGQVREHNGSHEYDYLRAELLWYLKPQGITRWDSGIRFDIRTRKGSRAEKFAINWTNQWKLSEKWQLRAILIGAWEFGGTAKTGTLAETRFSIMRKMNNGTKVGLETFNDWGKLTNMGSWDKQKHQIGPAISGKISNVKYKVGYLAGISDSANDHDLRIWFSKQF